MAQEQQFDFYSVALAKFLQAVPELGNYIITFKDVSEDLKESEDIKVGVFILRVGQEVFYVPVVSKMDNVYPIDSIFFTSTSKFFPITKKTCEVIITSSKLSQGKPAKIPSTFSQNPDVSHMINPPRTGKFAYASSSRLGDFLASMPDYLKAFTMEKIAEEKSVYENLHKLFGIRDIFTALKPAPQGLAAVTNQVPVSVVTGASTNLTPEEITSILDKGYSVSGTPDSKRVALSAQLYEDGKFTEVTELDGNSDHELVFTSGVAREAFIPKQLNAGQSGSTTRNTVALFTNGDYAAADSFIVSGENLNRTDVLGTIFNNNPPILPRDVMVDDTFAIIDGDARLLGVFNAHKVVLSNLGVEIHCYARAGMSGGYVIHAYRNYGQSPSVDRNDIYVPYSTLVLKLGQDVTWELERSINSAARKREISEAGILGDQLNLGFDGVEFTCNGKVVGSEANLMSKLAVDEGIEPELADTFIKQAKERRFAKIYLSKKASTDFRAGQIAEFGGNPPPVPKTGLNGSFMPSVQNSLKIGDAQATEVTIISELLQTPDMYELIEEYLPDIQECVDKLGRVLFLSRVHINQLAENNDADGVFAFLASLKAVYRMLGDNLLKLQEMLAIKPDQK